MDKTEIIVNTQFQSADPHQNGDMFFVVEEGILSYVIVSKQNANGRRSIKKVKLKEENRFHMDHLPKKNIKYVFHVGIKGIPK